MEKFTPGQDDIEAYIRDVKETAHQLNYNDEVILHLIKATMPSEIYGTLYNQNDLNTVITMVKDIYTKKPEVANPPLATGGANAPFTLIKAPNGINKRVHFTKNSTMHTSPVMLVARKGNERKRPVVDFRLLNTRIIRRNTSTPLLRDIHIIDMRYSLWDLP